MLPLKICLKKGRVKNTGNRNYNAIVYGRISNNIEVIISDIDLENMIYNYNTYKNDRQFLVDRIIELNGDTDDDIKDELKDKILFIQDIQIHPIKRKILHLDIYACEEKDTITRKVRISYDKSRSISDMYCNIINDFVVIKSKA